MCCLSLDSAGGVLILGWWESALFFKSSLFERLKAASSDFWKTLLADFQQPRSQPPTKPQRQTAHASRAGVSRREKVYGDSGGWLEWEVEWFDGRGWGISAALDAWGERLSFPVV